MSSSEKCINLLLKENPVRININIVLEENCVTSLKLLLYPIEPMGVEKMSSPLQVNNPFVTSQSIQIQVQSINAIHRSSGSLSHSTINPPWQNYLVFSFEGSHLTNDLQFECE